MSGPQTQQLGAVAQFIRGITFKPTDVVPLGTTDSIGCFRTKNIQSDIDLSDVFALPSRFLKKSGKLVQEGDLLVSTANSLNLVGKCCWVPHLPWPATVGGFIAALRADEQKVIPRYLYRWFSWARTQDDVRRCARQTTNIANLSISRCLELEIPLPSLAEQRRLAAILDQADALVRLRRESIEGLERLINAKFSALFAESRDHVAEVSLGDLFTITRGGSPRPIADYLTEEPDGLNWVSISDATDNGKFIRTAKRRIRANGASRSRRVEPGDFLLTNSMSFGRPYIMATTGYIHDGWLSLRPKDDRIDQEYLYRALGSPQTYAKFARLASGATVKNLNIDLVRSVTISVPPITVQNRFAGIAKGVDQALDRAKAHLSHLDALFASLQQRAFKGEL